MTPLQLAARYFPEFTAEELESVIWGHTGFPEFWNIPEDGKNPQECFRRQLHHAAVTYYRTDRLPEDDLNRLDRYQKVEKWFKKFWKRCQVDLH